MKRFIAPLLRPLRRGPVNRGRLIDAPPPAGALNQHDARAVANQLCRTLDRAVELELWEHAQRVACTAARLAQQSPQLTERLARLALIRSDDEAALAIFEACPARTQDMSLLRVLCMIRTGRIAEAHLEVFRWSRQAASAAPSVRLLLALLEWNAGDTQAAITALLNEIQENRPPDLRVLALLVAVCTAAGRHDQARVWSRRLRRRVDTDWTTGHNLSADPHGRDQQIESLPARWSPDLSVHGEVLAQTWLNATVEDLLAEALRWGFKVAVRAEPPEQPNETSPDPAILKFAPTPEGHQLRRLSGRRRQAA